MEYVLILSASILAFAIVLLAVPSVLKVARAKKLFDSFDERKIHKADVPPLGGVAIFLGFVLSTIIATDDYSFDSLKYIIAAIILMFFIGLKDDLLNISAREKFIKQIFAVALLIILGNVHFSNLHGFLGWERISPLAGALVSLFVMLAIVNAFNLVDGIDGLASSLGIIGSAFMGAWFFLAGYIPLAIMSFALTGSLAGFFIFNVFGRKNKLFMGDTGSLVVGLVMATLVVKFNEMNVISAYGYHINNAPVISFAVVIVPLIDTFRVMTIRILNKKSPFAPDKNHIHHRLLELVPNHLAVTAIIVAINLLLIGVTVIFSYLEFNLTLQFGTIFMAGISLSFVPSHLVNRKQKVKKAEPKPAMAKNHWT
jgi:UDP-N-acetylmuramyl pentapeptide phosphotransferase/UDP-N-acetylglucosamine-1-phosphate transferase